MVPRMAPNLHVYHTMLKKVTPDKPWTEPEAAHLLNRAGFGGTPSEIRTLHQLGREKAVAKLLDFGDESDRFPAPEWTADEISRNQRREYFMERQKLNDIEDPTERAKERQQLQRKLRGTQREQTSQMIAWWLDRMLKTKHPLRERMALFWHGHFATSLQKVRAPQLMWQQNALFREHALGDFKRLTNAICEDPAMMIYLDTNQNRKGKPNENFARELLELFTLGEGNYSEKDIKEAARAFTGYNIDRRKAESRFLPRQHDHGKKEVLGESGRFKAPDIVAIALEQDACAKFIGRKLWEYFVCEDPDKSTINDLAKVFKKSGFQVKPVVEAIFLSEAFYERAVIRDQIKSPVQFLVQLARQLELKKIPLNIATSALSTLGQALFYPPNVAGWEGGKSWINTNTLLTRYNVAGLLVKGRSDPEYIKSVMKGADGRMMSRNRRGEMRNFRGPDFKALAPPRLRKRPERLVRQLCYRLFQADLKPEDREKFDAYAKSKQDGAFTDLEVAELLHLMMSTPHYQLT